MEPDIIIKGNALELHGQVNVVADATEVKVTGNLAGYAFVDRTDQANRFVLYANNNKVHIWKDGLGDILTLGLDIINTVSLSVRFIDAVGITTNGIIVNGTSAHIQFDDSTNPQTYFNLFGKDNKIHFAQKKVGDLLTINNGEIEMKGEFSSYAFHDRKNTNNRFVLYAVDNTIRFWKDGVGDMLTINENGSVIIKYKQNGSSKELDLLKTISDLKDSVRKLEIQVGKLTK